MWKPSFCAAALLATLSINGHCQEDGARRWGEGGRPSEAQIAEWRARRAAREAAGEPSAKPAEAAPGNGRPPEGASPEEKRAFYQKRAAERARAEATAEPTAAAPATASHSHGSEAGKAVAGGPPPKAAAARPESGGRPAGMPPGLRGGGNVVWLSDSPPSRGDGPPRGGMGGMGGMAMGGDRSGPPVKRLWLRAGTDPQKSGFAREDTEAPAETLLVTPQGKAEGEPLPPPEEGRKTLSFEMPVQGYYRLYVTSRKLLGDALSVSVAKAEVTNFSYSGDEEERAQARAASRVLESAPIEIVRERQAGEKLLFQLKSGDDQAFVVLQKGLPAQGARVRFVSHQGWVKEALSDEQGRVSFQVIRDYFPPWDDFQKRFKATYLVIAEASAAESGNYKDQPYTSVRYQATLSGAYYPSPYDYRSYAWGLGIGLTFVAFGGLAIYLYRRRRVKPFQEARFDEKA